MSLRTNLEATVGTRYFDRINGQRVVAGSTVRLPGVWRVRFHAVRRWNRLYWTCDRLAEIWRTSKREAFGNTPHGRVDTV